MKVSEYQEQVGKINKEINSKIAELVNNFKQLVSENSHELLPLILDDNFYFLDKDGQAINIVDNAYIELFKFSGTSIYLNSTDGGLITVNYDADMDLNLPSDIDSSILNVAFKNVDNYKSAIHVVGLTGILKQDLILKSQILDSLNNLETA